MVFQLSMCRIPFSETLAVAANVNIEEILKLAPDRPPNTTIVTKGGKTGNLFAESVCWEQMTRKIKSANKVETSTKGCYFALCVFFLSFSLFHKAPCFLENTVRGSWLNFDEKS